MDKEEIENLFSLNPELEKRIKTILHIEYDKLKPIGYIKRDMIRCRSLAWTVKYHTILKLLFTKLRE